MTRNAVNHTRASIFLAGALILSLPTCAQAEVIAVTPGGFEVREDIHVTVSADKAYAALITPAKWWSGDHTFSHNAANLKLDAQAGGCWCESLPGGGSVEHMHVLYASPGKALRLRGALGPFQGLAVDGVMTISLKSAESGTDIQLSYAIGGYSKDGFEMAARGVDGVLAEQILRLKKLIDG